MTSLTRARSKERSSAPVGIFHRVALPALLLFGFAAAAGPPDRPAVVPAPLGAQQRLAQNVQQAAAISTAPAGNEAFEEWVALATAHPKSPATAEAGDRTIDWIAPNNQKVHLVVKVPHPTPNAPTVTLDKVPDGADARPYFEEALARVKAQKAGRLVIPTGIYTFKSLSPDKLGHLVIRDLSDVTVDGGESTLVFTQNETGIFLSSNQRLKITRVNLEYSLHMASLGQISALPGGNNVLVIDPRFPVTQSDAITYLSEYDPVAKHWMKPGERILIPPGSPTPATFIGNQTYTSASFKQATPGKSFVVFHQWYGGIAIRIADLPGTSQSEDLTLDGVTIYSGPGMGIVAYGIKRGLAIVKSTIAPKPGPLTLISTEYDAIHILVAGGDVIIDENQILGQNDDGINFDNPVQPIVVFSDDGTKVTLSAYSRFIRPGDTLAFFDANGDFTGKADVVSIEPLGGLNNEITLTKPVAGITASTVVRDLQLINSRYAIKRNTIANCHCAGMLLQAPYGMVTHNTISDISYNAMRLLTNIGYFKEGVGAIDVIVKENTISGTGSDNSPGMPWAAISAYGRIRNNAVTASPVNSDLQIVGNKISNVKQGCITVMSSRRVTVSGNTCEGDVSGSGGSPAISVRNSSAVLLKQNHLSGSFAGKIDVDATTTKDVNIKED